MCAENIPGQPGNWLRPLTGAVRTGNDDSMQQMKEVMLWTYF
ncbi:hypothetical protein B425_3739 [Bacillus amyloliquefaciens]|nr:hypothetical protein B425_3739 [Bacillus amyloliquefaciens]